MRFREKQLLKIYPEIDLNNAYVLWIDVLPYYDFDYENITTSLELSGKHILSKKNETFNFPIHKVYSKDKVIAISVPTPKLKHRTPFPNKRWASIDAVNGNKIATGIPFVFDSFAELSMVTELTGTVSYSIRTKEDVIIHLKYLFTIETSFEQQEDKLDYNIELQLFTKDKYKMSTCFRDEIYTLIINLVCEPTPTGIGVLLNPIKNESGLTQDELQSIGRNYVSTNMKELESDIFDVYVYHGELQKITPYDERNPIYFMNGS